MRVKFLSYSVAGLVFLGALLASAAVTGDDAVDQWTVDGDRSSITFQSNAPMESFSGTTEDISGSIQWNRSSPQAATGEISFPVESLRTGNRTRDRHLAGDDWLNADASPDVRFALQGLEDVRVARTESGQIHYRANAKGTIEVNGVENATDASVQVAVLPQDRLARIQFELEFALADHNVEGVGGDRAIGTAVGEVIQVEGTVFAAWN